MEAAGIEPASLEKDRSQKSNADNGIGSNSCADPASVPDPLHQALHREDQKHPVRVVDEIVDALRKLSPEDRAAVLARLRSDAP